MLRSSYDHFHFSLPRFSVLVKKNRRNGSGSRNIKNYINFSFSCCIVWTSWSQRDSGFIFWLDIDQAPLISIYHSSDSVSWWTQNKREVALSPEILIIAAFSPILHRMNILVPLRLLFFLGGYWSSYDGFRL